MVDILSTFCGVFMVQYVRSMLRISEFWALLFDCFVYHQNVTCMLHFDKNLYYVYLESRILLYSLLLYVLFLF